LERQEAWDNSGLQVGKRDAEIHAVLLTTDVTEAVVAEAIERGCELIVSHHPLLFHGLKHVTGTTPQERIVEQAILHGIAIYSSHTAMDVALHGVSGRIAERLGLKDYTILSPEGGEYGLGVIGRLAQSMEWEAFLAMVKQRMEAPMLRYVSPVSPCIQCVALCGGAGAEFIDEAVRQGADVYITADCRYHQLLDAVGRIGVVDMDHWVSEHYTREVFAELLQGKVETYMARSDGSPVQVYC